MLNCPVGRAVNTMGPAPGALRLIAAASKAAAVIPGGACVETTPVANTSSRSAAAIVESLMAGFDGDRRHRVAAAPHPHVEGTLNSEPEGRTLNRESEQEHEPGN